MLLALRVSRPLVKVAVHDPDTVAGTVGQVTLAVSVALLPLTVHVKSQPLEGSVTIVPETLPAAMTMGPFNPSVWLPEDPEQVSVWATEAFQLPIHGVVLALPLPQAESASGATQRTTALIAGDLPTRALLSPGNNGIFSSLIVRKPATRHGSFVCTCTCTFQRLRRAPHRAWVSPGGDLEMSMQRPPRIPRGLSRWHKLMSQEIERRMLGTLAQR
jgi:hypothetical protein